MAPGLVPGPWIPPLSSACRGELLGQVAGGGGGRGRGGAPAPAGSPFHLPPSLLLPAPGVQNELYVVSFTVSGPSTPSVFRASQESPRPPGLPAEAPVCSTVGAQLVPPSPAGPSSGVSGPRPSFSPPVPAQWGCTCSSLKVLEQAVHLGEAGGRVGGLAPGPGQRSVTWFVHEISDGCEVQKQCWALSSGRVNHGPRSEEAALSPHFLPAARPVFRMPCQVVERMEKQAVVSAPRPTESSLEPFADLGLVLPAMKLVARRLWSLCPCD